VAGPRGGCACLLGWPRRWPTTRRRRGRRREGNDVGGGVGKDDGVEF